MLEVYRKVLALFDDRERRRLFFVLLIMVLVALSELISMSAVLMLLGLLAQPERIRSNEILQSFYDGMHFTSIYGFQLFLAALTFLAVMMSLVVRAGGTYTITRFSAMRGYSLSRRLLVAYLYRPYSWFLGQNSADIVRAVLTEVEQLVFRVVVPGLRVIASALMAIVIICFLLFVDPVIMILAFVLLGGSYVVIYLRLRSILRRLGEAMMSTSGERFRVTQEAMGGFKELKLLGLEESYLGRFDRPARLHADHVSRLQLFGELPRFFLEGLAVGVLLSLVMLLLVRNNGDLATTIPVLGTFAFAVMRLLPALQQIYNGMSSIRSGTAVLDRIYADYMATKDFRVARQTTFVAGAAVVLQNSLELDCVSYSYENSKRTAISNLTLRIPARTTIGIVGGTGAGKTTLIDLILGLLQPQMGKIKVDGVPILAENVRSWQDSLGYVPQQIYLTDDTIAQNIAFGVPRDKIDLSAVEAAARIAALHEFIVTDLPHGYETRVGERGVRLSGGQRQRIGIARALYTNPSLLIMDEATSALDNITERVVMDAVQNIRQNRTIILIAHRLSTVKNCDIIFLLENGKVVSSGTYDELITDSATFRRMATGV